MTSELIYAPAHREKDKKNVVPTRIRREVQKFNVSANYKLEVERR